MSIVLLLVGGAATALAWLVGIAYLVVLVF
jgi:hypothetical protein